LVRKVCQLKYWRNSASGNEGGGYKVDATEGLYKGDEEIPAETRR